MARHTHHATALAGVARAGGFSLILVLAILAVGLGLWALIQLVPAQLARPREAATDEALARAKEALIAYAAAQALPAQGYSLGPFPSSPGTLPCPATLPGGVAANCGDNALGLLPWATLGIPQLLDGSGSPLWYAVSRNFRVTDRLTPVNTDTAGTITVRDSTGAVSLAAQDVVAVVLAPGAPLAAQNARANAAPAIAQYLDGGGADGNTSFSDTDSNNGFTQGPVRNADGTPLINDRLITITRDELMAAVNKRIAAEVRACLEVMPVVPWPAPLSSAYNGTSNTYFGRVPDTNPSKAVRFAELAQALQSRTSALYTASDAAAQQAALSGIKGVAAAAKASASALASVLANLTSLAVTARNRNDDARAAAAKAAATLSSSTISTLDTETAKALTATSNFVTELAAAAIDPFAPAYVSATSTFSAALTTFKGSSTQANARVLRDASDGLRDMAAFVVTGYSDLDSAASATYSAAQTSREAAAAVAASATSTKIATAIAAGETALAAANALQATIAQGTVNLPNDETYLRALLYTPLVEARNAFAAPTIPTSELTLQLDATASQTLSAVNAIETDSPSITTAVASARSALTSLRVRLTALANTLTLGGASDLTLVALRQQILTASSTATTTLESLISAILYNPDNVSVAAIKYRNAQLQQYYDAFFATPSTGGASSIETLTRTQRNFLRDVVIPQLTTLSSLVASTSAAADAVNASLGSLSASNDVIVLPVGLTGQLGTLASAVGTLSGTLQAAQQKVRVEFINWQSAGAPTCYWLNAPSTGFTTSQSWWARNAWKPTFFYQLSSPYPGVPLLRVNNGSSVEIVVLAAGRALGTQASRNSNPTNLNNYLEGRNSTTASTNNPATLAAQPDFQTGPPSPTFNDQLAY